MIQRVFRICIMSMCLSILGCASGPTTTYEALGGQEKIAEIVEHFIAQIAFDKPTFDHFKDTDVERFREKLSEQLCAETGGPCTYTGDSMAQVHAKMNITEAQFNRSVELLIAAMNTANVPYRLQNKVLARLAPMRKDILYR